MYQLYVDNVIGAQYKCIKMTVVVLYNKNHAVKLTCGSNSSDYREKSQG